MANVHVVHNGICVEQFTFNPTGGGGMVYLGRIEPVKGTATAIRVAHEIGMPLTIAGPIIDRGYFDAEVQPHLSGQIQYVGKVNHREKNELLGNATCLIAPFKGEEPFGLVSIEAMACGTPVAALPNGALPEIITDGVTGYLAPNEALLASAVQRAASLDRRQVRRHVAERFNIRVAAERYLHVFRHIVAADAAEHPSPS
jgi:glycosyltransferase involved in cell wall biosynthesis